MSLGAEFEKAHEVPKNRKLIYRKFWFWFTILAAIITATGTLYGFLGTQNTAQTTGPCSPAIAGMSGGTVEVTCPGEQQGVYSYVDAVPISGTDPHTYILTFRANQSENLPTNQCLLVASSAEVVAYIGSPEDGIQGMSFQGMSGSPKQKTGLSGNDQYPYIGQLCFSNPAPSTEEQFSVTFNATPTSPIAAQLSTTTFFLGD